MENMSIAEPVKILLSRISCSEPFSSGIETIATFLKNTEEQWDPVNVIQSFFCKDVPLKLQEYILFCFLEITRADSKTLYHSISYKRLNQLLYRRQSTLFPCSEKECQILVELKKKTGIDTSVTLMIASRISKNWADLLMNSADIGDRERMQLSCLLKYEAAALRERTSCLSDNVNSYDMKAIARLLPMLTICDEYANSVDELSTMVLNRKAIGQPVLFIQQLMRNDGFGKFLSKLSKSPELSLFLKTLKLQQDKLIPVQRILAAATLCRWISNDEESPLKWIVQALELTTEKDFVIDAGDSFSRIKPFLINSGVEIDGSVLKMNFNNAAISTLIGTDMLTRPPAAQKEISIQELVSRNIANDVLLIRLLENPKVYNKPGLVEKIATRSRSISVLQKIASSRELYTGQANAGVPLALLKNPTSVPISLLRMFIHPAYVSLNSMRELLRNPYGVRREIFTEVKLYVERKK